MFLVDSITCYCYMMLRKLHYAKWDAKNTAVINSSVVLNCVLNTFLDIFLFFVSSDLLQSLYNFPKTRYVLSIFFCMVFLDCRYYIFHKDAICLIGGKINPSIIKASGYFLLLLQVYQLVRQQSIFLLHNIQDHRVGSRITESVLLIIFCRSENSDLDTIPTRESEGCIWN